MDEATPVPRVLTFQWVNTVCSSFGSARSTTLSTYLSHWLKGGQGTLPLCMSCRSYVDMRLCLVRDCIALVQQSTAKEKN